MLTGTWPPSARPVDMPICISSVTGSSSNLSRETFLSVLLMAVPGQATAWPRKIVRSSRARNSIARHISSKYFMSELDALAGAGMRIFGLILVIDHQRMAAVFVSEHGLVPRFARVGADGFGVVLDDETDWQLMIRRILEEFVKAPGFRRHVSNKTMHACLFAAASAEV